MKTLDNYAPIGQALQQERALVAHAGGRPRADGRGPQGHRRGRRRAAADHGQARPQRVPGEHRHALPRGAGGRTTTSTRCARMVDTQAQDTIIKRNYDAVIQGQISPGRVDRLTRSGTASWRSTSPRTARSRTPATTWSASCPGRRLMHDAAGAVARRGACLPTRRSPRPSSARSTARAAVAGLGVDNLRLPPKDPTSDFTRMRPPLEHGQPGRLRARRPRRLDGRTSRPSSSRSSTSERRGPRRTPRPSPSAPPTTPRPRPLSTIGVVVAGRRRLPVLRPRRRPRHRRPAAPPDQAPPASVREQLPTTGRAGGRPR